MTARTLVVLVGDDVAGELRADRSGRLTFTYDDQHRHRADATPLSVSMPLAVAEHGDATVRPWLWGLLPDSTAVLERWARRYSTSAASPFGLLAAPPGRDCPGAVRFVPPEELDEALARPGQVEWLSEDDVAGALRALRTDGTTWLGPGFTGRFSLAGAQAKTALLHQDGRWGRPSGSAATSHILKPAIAGFDDHDLNEHLCLRAAAHAGLLVARSEIRAFGDERAVVVERYDRRWHGDRLVRIHQEDACQALGVAPAAKYQADGGPGPAQLATLLRRTVPPNREQEARERLAEALVWAWLTGGTDAHAKNYSLLLSGPEVRLAPLYDLASALPYGDHEQDLRLAMKLGGDYRLHTARPSTWDGLAAELELDRAAVVQRAQELCERTPSAFDAALAELGEDQPPMAERLRAAVRDRCHRVAPSIA